MHNYNSALMISYSPECKHDRVTFAKCINAIRREVLKEVKDTGFIAQQRLSAFSPTSQEFENKLQSLFQERLDTILLSL